MFNIVASPTFTCPVSLSRPEADLPVKVTFTFKHKSRRAIRAWLDSAATAESDAAWLDEAVDGWGEELRGEDGQPLPYSLRALDRLLNEFPASCSEITAAYLERLQETRRGNSARPLGR